MDDLELFRPGQVDREELEGTPVLRPTVLPKSKLRPDLAAMFDDAYEILAAELERLKQKARENPNGLNATEAGILAKHVNSLTNLSKEERQHQEDDPLELDDVTLKKLLMQKLLLEEAKDSGLVR